MEKRKWETAIKTSKKAKDKSIYTFIVWRYLLERNNLADYRAFFINSDGSKAEICGNALRCIGKYHFEKEKIKNYCYFYFTLVAYPAMSQLVIIFIEL